MILLSYTLRPGVDTAEYDAWLREVDNPFFNGVPGIARYTNWKITAAATPVPFTHFDFMGVDSVEAAADVWQRQDVKDFTAEWRRLWGMGPEATDLSVNAHVYLFENAAAAGLERSEVVTVTMTTQQISDAPPKECWNLVRSVRGEPRFQHLRTQAGGAPTVLPPETLSAVLIAGPT
jgi:hypothetical protein